MDPMDETSAKIESLIRDSIPIARTMDIRVEATGALWGA